MACPSITAAAATDALRAAGYAVTRTTGADAARRYGCQTLRYVVDGCAVNVGRLRQLALAAADAASVPAPALATLRADAAAGRPVSLAALPPVTAAQDRALALCRSADCHTRPGVYHTPAA
jgi:hypothetical protein